MLSDNSLYLGDCIEVMKNIDDRSIDMILCDLPYGTTACKWDVIIPFDKLWEQYNRIIKDNSAIILFGTEPFSSHLRLSNLSQYKYDWIWIKNRPTDKFNAKNKPMPITENISVFSNGVTANVKTNNRMIYYPQGLIDCNKEIRGTTGKWDSVHRPSHKEKYILTKTGYPNNILEFKKDENHLHNTQKPIALCEYLIKTYSLEDDLILDNCMGSGTTCLAAKNLGRRYIGIEKDENYFDIAQKRINDEKS